MKRWSDAKILTPAQGRNIISTVQFSLGAPNWFCVCMDTSIHGWVDGWIRACTHVYMRVCIHACMYVCMYVYYAHHHSERIAGATKACACFPSVWLPCISSPCASRCPQEGVSGLLVRRATGSRKRSAPDNALTNIRWLLRSMTGFQKCCSIELCPSCRW